MPASDPGLTAPEENSSEVEQENENESGPDKPVQAPAELSQFHGLCFKTLKELNKAVRTYGPNAPFNLSLLKAIPEEDI